MAEEPDVDKHAAVLHRRSALIVRMLATSAHFLPRRPAACRLLRRFPGGAMPCD